MTDFRKLVLATHNRGKAREFSTLLAPLGITVACAADLNLPEPEETGTTFAENAVLKALHAAQGTGLPALADDSGLCVTALDGKPGIFSARWAGPDRDFGVAMEKINTALAVHQDRSAYFIAALALATPEGTCEIFEGRVDGEIVWPPRGAGGFGYDPVFMPRGHARTFGEMAEQEKDAISHRARAVEKLLPVLTAAES